MSSRIQKIKETYSQQFQQRLAQEKVDISLDSAWDIMISADPTKNKKNMRWLIETYLKNGYLWEDISYGKDSKVYETLVEFDKHKRNLEVSDRSLNRYEALGALWISIKPYIGQLTASEEKKSERDKAYAEAEVVVDREDGLKIIVPLTQYASKWFGRGTRWCTAADKNNMFSGYNRKAPLFIIMMPDGDKLQLWKHDKEIQFMDEADLDISLDYINKNWDVLEPIIHSLDAIYYYPDERKTYDMCMEAVKKDGFNLRFIPEALIDYDMSLAGVKHDGSILGYVPKKYKTKELCMEAVKHNLEMIADDDDEPLQRKNTLFCVPKDLRDYDLCLEAVRHDGYSFRLVSEELIDYEMSLAGVKNKGAILDCIPEKYKTRELCLEAVKQNGMALKFVPDELKDYEIYMEAVKQDGKSLLWIDNEFKTEALCLEAIRSNEMAMIWVPDEYKDYDICLQAVKNYGTAFQYVPAQYKDYNLCLETIKNNPNLLPYVPEQYQDYELCMEAVKKNGKVIDAVPAIQRDYNLCLEAVKQNGLSLHWINSEFIDYNLCLEAVKQNEGVLNIVPDDIRSQLEQEVRPTPAEGYKEQIADMKELFQLPEPSLKM